MSIVGSLTYFTGACCTEKKRCAEAIAEGPEFARLGELLAERWYVAHVDLTRRSHLMLSRAKGSW